MWQKKPGAAKGKFTIWPWPFKRKSKHWTRGIWAERSASIYLQLKGYHVLQRRYKTPVGEVDLIIKKGNLLVAVEVKARPTLEQGLEAITFSQQNRIQQTMELYLLRYKKFRRSNLRFDLVVIKPWSWPKHLPNAWRA